MQTAFKSLLELLDYFKEEKTCLAFLELNRWGGNPMCPHCHKDVPYRTATRSKRPELAGTKDFKCSGKECGKKFTVISGTIFENSKLKLRDWIAAMFLVTAHKKGISSYQLGRDLNITQKSAWFAIHRIREMLKERNPEKLNNMVEVDETFVGGKNKNRHANKKVEGSQGGHSSDKTIVFGLVERGGKVKTQVIPNTTATVLTGAIKSSVASEATMISDEAKGYKKLYKQYTHLAVNHGNGEYVRGIAHTNTIEGFWSLLKRGILGTYHNVSPKHLHRYCDEFAYRYNNRTITDSERFTSALKNSEVRLKYADLIAK